MAFVTPTDVTVGSVLTASKYNQEVVENQIQDPRGHLGSSTPVTSNFTTSGTHTTFQDLTGYTVSATYAANRILRVSIEVGCYVPGGGNNVVYKIIRGSTDIREFYVTNEAVQGGVPLDLFYAHTFTGPASGATETFKVQIAALTNNTQVGNGASSARPGRIIVEDLGAA